jgi:hypothetical protein
MRRRLTTVGVVLVASLSAAPTAFADRDPYPHEFHHNMGYCAPYLAQVLTPSGERARPWINHLLRDLTRGGEFEGQRNVGDLYSDRARDEQDQNCVAR